MGFLPQTTIAYNYITQFTQQTNTFAFENGVCYPVKKI